MKYFHIIFVALTSVVPKSQTNEKPQVSDSFMDIFESKETRNLTHPHQPGYQSSKSLNDYDDAAYESWYKPHRELYLTPVRMIKKIGMVPEIITGLVEVRRRPTSQYFYKIFIRDSPGLHFNHVIQTGAPKPYEGNFSNGLYVSDRNAVTREFNKASGYGIVFHRELLSDVLQRENVSDREYGSSSTFDNKHRDAIGGQSTIRRLNNGDEMALNGRRYTESIPQQPNLGVVTSQSTPIPEADVSNLPEIDIETTKKLTGTIMYSSLTGTTEKENDMKTDGFEFSVDGTLQPNKTEVKTETVKVPSQFFAESYETPIRHADLPGSKAIDHEHESNDNYRRPETLYGLRNNHVISRTKNLNPQNKTSHIMKLPKVNQNQVVTENDEYTLDKTMGSLHSTGSIHPGHEGVHTYSPERISASAINFQKSTVFYPKPQGIGRHFHNHGLIRRTSPVPDRKEIPQHLYGNLASVIPDNRDVRNREPSSTVTTLELPANFHGPRKIYTLEDVLKWRKGYAYPIYGKHSSREMTRRKMILNLKSGTVQKYKTSHRQ